MEIMTKKAMHVVLAVVLGVVLLIPAQREASRTDGGHKLSFVAQVAPTTPWNTGSGITVGNIVNFNNRQPIFVGIGPQKISLASMTFASVGTQIPANVLIIVYVSNSASGDCLSLTGASFDALERFWVTVPSNQTVHLSWPSGALIYTSFPLTGHRYCLDAEAHSVAPGNYRIEISASGFTG
jgi:hypothetical protein